MPGCVSGVGPIFRIFHRGSAIGWLNGAMTDADVDDMIDAFDSSLVRLREDGAL